jgi:hypothetical protein
MVRKAIKLRQYSEEGYKTEAVVRKVMKTEEVVRKAIKLRQYSEEGYKTEAV